MKVLITGIEGFAGKYLRRALLEKGYDVYGFDLHSQNENIFQVDITDSSSVHSHIKKISPHHIIHLAAISRVDHKNPKKLYEVNINGTINILSSAVQIKKRPGVLVVSSSQVYGIVPEERQPIKESAPLDPVNHYGAGKAAIENIAKAFHFEHDLPLVIARPFNHTGRGQRIDFVVPKIVKAFKNRERSIKLGNIDAVRDFLDVRDVARAYVKIIENFPDYEILNIAGGFGIKISDIIDRLIEITGHKIRIEIIDNYIRENDIPMSVGDPQKIKKLFNWKIKYDIRDILLRMLE